MLESAVIPLDLVLIVVTATVLAFAARKTGQPTIVAYILTGIVLGPVVFGLVQESELTRTMSELGLAFLLFLLGLEMDISDIRQILPEVAKITVVQTILQRILAFLVFMAVGFTLIESAVIAAATVCGATPVVVKILKDKGEISALPGRIDVGVLIIQDILLVVILALFSTGSLSDPAQIGVSAAKIVLLTGLVGLVSYGASKIALSRIFNPISGNNKALLVSGLGWAFIMVALSQELGLSVEVGAFLAGIGLGQVRSSSELEEQVRPLTDFFIMVFFSSIGLSLERESFLSLGMEALAASAALMAGNFAIMFFLIDRQKFTPKTSFLGSINMTQISEFTLVVGTVAVSQGMLPEKTLGFLSAVALVTMSTSSYFINYNKAIYRRLEPFLQKIDSDAKQDVESKTLSDHAVILGFDHLAENLVPVLEPEYDNIVIVDNDPSNAEELSEMEHEFIYGDFKHQGIRSSTNLRQADIVVSVSTDHQLSKEVLRYSGKDTSVLLKANKPERALELYELGAHYVVLKSASTGDKMSEYLSTYIESEESFYKEVEPEIEQILGENK